MDDANPRSPLRTVQVLHELANAAQAVPLGVLAARLELPKTSLFRLLRALEVGVMSSPTTDCTASGRRR